MQAGGYPHKYRVETAAAEADASSNSHAHDGHHSNPMSGSEVGMQAKLEDSEGQVAVLSARVAVLKRERAELDARFAHQEALLRQSMQQGTGIGMQIGKVRASVGLLMVAVQGMCLVWSRQHLGLALFQQLALVGTMKVRGVWPGPNAWPTCLCDFPPT